MAILFRFRRAVQLGCSVGGFGGQGQCVQFAMAAIHLAFQGGVYRTLLLHAVQPAKAVVDHLCGVVVSVAGKVGDRDFPVWKALFQQRFQVLRRKWPCVWSLSGLGR